MTGITMRGARRGAALLVALTATLVGTGAAAPAGAALPTCTRSWLGGSGSWTDATKWSGGVVPTAADHVCITSGIGSVDLRATSVTVASLQLGSGTEQGLRTLTVVPDGVGLTAAITATGGIDVQLGGELVLGGVSTTATPGGTARVSVGEGAEIANGGTITSTSGSDQHTAVIEGRVVNPGLIRVWHPLMVAEVVTTGSIEIDSSSLIADRFEGAGGFLTGTGRVVSTDLELGDMQSGSGNDATWPILQITNGPLAITGDEGTGFIEARGTVDLTGQIHRRQGVHVVSQEDLPATLRFSGSLANAGSIVLEPRAGRPATVQGTGAGAVVTSTGVLDLQPAPLSVGRIEADLVNRGIAVTGDGVLDITGDLRNEGYLDLELGEVAVGGDLDLRATSELHHDLQAGGPRGYIEATGDAAVGGTLQTTTLGPTPAVGALFSVIEAASRTGALREHVFVGPASYDLLHLSTRVELERRASEPAAERFVRAAYQDFLGRQPTTEQREERADAIEAGILTRASLVRELSMSTEYVTALVQDLYLDTLGRPGDPAGVAFWVDQLRTGRKTVAQVAGSFYGSDEYVEQAGGTAAAWINALFEVLLDREATSSDRSYWVGRATEVGRSRVALELFQSLESRRERVDRLYLALLGRVGDPAGVTYWAGRLTREGDLALAVSLAASGEYLQRAEVRYP